MARMLRRTRPEAYNVMGVIKQVTIDLNAAREMYRTALALDPSYRPAQTNQENLSQPPSRRDLGQFDLGEENE